MPNTWDVVTLSTLHHNTSEITVVNNAGLEVRQLVYYRNEAEKKAAPQISLQRYDSAGYLTHSIDARLSEHYLNNPTTTIPNQGQVNTLSGVVLQSKNADAGMRVSISDVRGLNVWTNDSLGNEQTFDYDKLAHVTSVSEKTQGKKVIRERFIYGDNVTKAINGVGRLLKHYDTAGLREVKRYNVQGSVLNESRQFLADTALVDWPEALTERQKQLETQSYTTQWDYNSLGDTISQIDAKGNQHRTQYGIAGEFVSSHLQLNAGTEQTIISKQSYSATGQLLTKQLANGVVIHYAYEEKTQRLRRLHSLRLADNKSLQDLNYRYDPVGNILEVIDKAQEPAFYANQKTEAISQYRYDSLYQLIEAIGIESQQAGKESTTRTPALILGNADASRCVNYTRNYTYDAGGNLYEIQHHGAQRYTRSLHIAADSNRGIEKQDSGPSLLESFDANGNLLYLNTEQPLQWDSRNQLQHIIQLKRETHSDAEQYRYDANAQRVEKLTQRLSENQLHYERVRYLPGIELREHWQTDTQGQNKKVIEQLHMIQSDSVRVLHWETGKPNDIENDGLRYPLTDQLGSTQLELNAKGDIISYESYYPYGGTAIWATKSVIETHYKFIRYSGKEQDASGLYYYGYRYYLPWLGRWLNPDPSGISDGLNLFRMAYNNPISFYDNDGKKPTPTLKQTYPPEIHPFTKTTYHTIKEVYGFIDPSKKVEVDVRVWEAEVQGQPIRLITGPKRAERVALDVHAGFIDIKDVIHLKKDMPTITVIGPHGARIDSVFTKTSKTYAKISYEGITLSSQQALDTFINEKAGYIKITGNRSQRTIQNIRLGKVPTIPEDARVKHYLEGIARTVHRSREMGNPLDFITLRKNARLSAREIIMDAIGYGYKEVILSTCRGPAPMQDTDPIYRPDETTVLDEPIFQTWKQTWDWNAVQKIFI